MEKIVSTYPLKKLTNTDMYNKNNTDLKSWSNHHQSHI